MTFNDLVGKTIVSVTKLQHRDYPTDHGFLRLGFSDGNHVVIISYFGDYTGNSEEEYPTGIGICSREKETDLIEYETFPRNTD